MGRTQGGNNNAYCQDNEISWIDWELGSDERELLALLRYLLHLRKSHAVFRRKRFFAGKPVAGTTCKDVMWFNPRGTEMNEEQWRDPFARCLGLGLAGTANDEVDKHGSRVYDDNFLLLLNAHDDSIPFVLPPCSPQGAWELLLDTTYVPFTLPGRHADERWEPIMDVNPEAEVEGPVHFASSETYPLGARSVALLVERGIGEGGAK